MENGIFPTVSNIDCFPVSNIVCFSLSARCASVHLGGVDLRGYSAKVMPDLRMGAQDCGQDATAESQRDWTWFQQLFLGLAPNRPNAAEAKAEKGRKRKAKALADGQLESRRPAAPKRAPRKSAHRHLKALDHVIAGVYG